MNSALNSDKRIYSDDEPFMADACINEDVDASETLSNDNDFFPALESEAITLAH